MARHFWAMAGIQFGAVRGDEAAFSGKVGTGSAARAGAANTLIANKTTTRDKSFVLKVKSNYELLITNYELGLS